MSDDDKSKTDEATDEVADEVKEVAEEKAVEEKPAEETAQEPEAQKPASGSAASSEPTLAGTDQQGRQLYNVKCSNCGRDTQVPFKPSGDRPVYCRDCYMQKKNS